MKSFLKKWLPTKHQLQQESSLSGVKHYFFDPMLWHFSRRSVARGVAIGLFLAFVPLPMQMLLAVLVAILWRANLPIAVALTWITNPITFVPLNYFIFLVGCWVTNDKSNYSVMQGFQFKGSSWQEIVTHFWQWLSSIGKPFFVGLPIVAVSAALLGFVLTHLIWRIVIYLRMYKRKNK